MYFDLLWVTVVKDHVGEESDMSSISDGMGTITDPAVNPRTDPASVELIKGFLVEGREILTP